MHAANSPVAITGCGAAHVKLPEFIGKSEQWRFHKRGDADRTNFITTCCYHKSVVYYSRTMANARRKDMLFSSGDFPRTLSSILSGEGFDGKEQGKSPLAILGFAGCEKSLCE
jgi:hypothetical protein